MVLEIEYLSLLPAEILCGIIRGLDVVTVRSLAEATKWNKHYWFVSSECERRISVARYLSETFGDGHRLLRAMALCDAYIWGGKALGFFVCNRASDASTWDISVPNHGRNLHGFMMALEDLGVTWLTALEETREILTRGEGEITMDKWKWMRWSHELESTTRRDYGYEFSATLHHESFTNVKLHLERGKVSVQGQNYHQDSLTWSSDWMCVGEIKVGGAKVRVRLASEDQPRMHTVMKHHSSCMQAIIAPHSACHLYGKLACSMETYGWRLNVEDFSRPTPRPQLYPSRFTKGLSEAWRKLWCHGFEYVDDPVRLGGLRCLATDEQAILVEYPEHSGLPIEMAEADVDRMRYMRWFQTGINVSLFPEHQPFASNNACPRFYDFAHAKDEKGYREYMERYVPSLLH